MPKMPNGSDVNITEASKISVKLAAWLMTLLIAAVLAFARVEYRLSAIDLKITQHLIEYESGEPRTLAQIDGQ